MSFRELVLKGRAKAAQYGISEHTPPSEYFAANLGAIWTEVESMLEVLPKGTSLSFGAVLEALKSGTVKRAYREGWNGKGLRVRLDDEPEFMTEPFLYIEYPPPDGRRVPWLASQADMLAEDWHTE